MSYYNYITIPLDDAVGGKGHRIEVKMVLFEIVDLPHL